MSTFRERHFLDQENCKSLNNFVSFLSLCNFNYDIQTFSKLQLGKATLDNYSTKKFVNRQYTVYLVTIIPRPKITMILS